METHFMDKFCKTCKLKKEETQDCSLKNCLKFCKPWFILYDHYTPFTSEAIIQKRTTNAQEALDFFIEREERKLRDYCETGEVLIITDLGQKLAYKQSCIKEHI